MGKDNKEKYFIFLDETGNNNQEEFFGLGIIIVSTENIGNLYNILDKHSQKIKTFSKIKMINRLQDEYINGNHGNILDYAKSSKSFELKFKSVNQENYAFYSEMIKECFSVNGLFFASLVFDKNKKGYSADNISHWNRYLNNVAMLIVNNMKNFPDNAEFVILADQISQPKNAEKDYENTLFEKIENLIINKGLKNSIFGITRIESHSAPLVQLADILVGAVVYDFYNKINKRKEDFLKGLRELFNVKSFGKNLTEKKPIYFSVWEYNKK